MKKDSDPSLARALGHGYAYFQHGVDKVITWGFERMRQAGDSPVKESQKSRKKSIGGSVASVLRGTLSFFGTAGEEFYKKYEELKRKDQSKS